MWPGHRCCRPRALDTDSACFQALAHNAAGAATSLPVEAGGGFHVSIPQDKFSSVSVFFVQLAPDSASNHWNLRPLPKILKICFPAYRVGGWPSFLT